MNPYNMKYSIGNDLKEHPEDTVAFQKGIEYLKQKLQAAAEVIQQARLLSKIGVNQRIAGHLEESYQHLNAAKTILQNSDHKILYVVNEIRIAQTLQFLKQYAKAHNYYQQIETFVSRHPKHPKHPKHPSCSDLLHYVYQHKGKTYFDQGRYLLAQENIEKALTLRKELGNDELIQSSTFALSIIHHHQKISG